MPKDATKRKTKETKVKRKKGMSYMLHAPPSRKCSQHALDPNAPKRGLSAYMFFANDNRDSVREENPGIKFGTYTSHWQSILRLTILKARLERCWVKDGRL